MFLGIDIGTSGVKALVADADLRPVAEATVALKVASPAQAWREQAPEDWWVATVSACASVAAAAPEAWARIAAIGLSGQMHGPVVLDIDRRVIRPCILWNDTRAHAEAEALANLHPGMGAITGVPPHPGFTAPKLMWLARHEPAAHARIAHVLLPKDWIGMRLHGGIGTDMSDAAGTLWFDQRARRWSDDLAHATMTDPAWLPRCREGSDVAGYLSPDAAAALGLRAGLPVAAGGGDTAVGALGAGILADGAALLSVGTSGQILAATTEYHPNPAAFVHSFAHCVPGLWYRMGALVNGARPIAWYAGTCDVPIPDLLAEASVAEPGRTPMFLPYLSGERTPLADPHIRGSFVGLGDATTRGQMMRAVVEGVAYGFADAAAALWPEGDRPATLTGIGGGLRGDLVAQTLADVLGLTLMRAAGASTGPALGAARLAALAAGAARLGDLASPPATERAFAPQPSAFARHAARQARFRVLYQALQPLSR